MGLRRVEETERKRHVHINSSSDKLKRISEYREQNSVVWRIVQRQMSESERYIMDWTTLEGVRT